MNRDKKLMEVEKKLINYRDIESLNKVDEIKIKKLKDKATSGGAIEMLQAKIDNRLLEKETIDIAIGMLGNMEAKIIELRYFNKPIKSWVEISLEVNLSVAQCVRVRRKALQRLVDILEVNEQ